MLREAAAETGTRPPSDDFPNAKFVSRWLAKHPQISIRHAQLLDVKRAEGSPLDAVARYFNNLKSVLKKLNLTDKPECIWNCDETGICPQGHGGVRVICPEGLRANVQRSSDRENTSIMACISASGERMQPWTYSRASLESRSGWQGQTRKQNAP
ncbi:hypothetical protein JG688_00016424 [Phytophthora aleatoria]|uniref:Uncharacterized protein n=1 Tax=Phytophthora aleatoria TaxID=2496075 RepID=A0A8J5LYZ4_9STRA|nr:hypothetical protein JG688_00016424 [Phytophthora aleatoria]